MNNFKIYPYKMGSESAKDLANLLGTMRVRDLGRYNPKPTHVVLNWGNGKQPSWAIGVRKILNDPRSVNIAGNKLSTLQTLQRTGISIPEFTTSEGMAEQWSREGHIVVERHELRGSSGKGIRVVQPREQLQTAPLYTKYIPKSAEYRVHVFNGKVIDFVQKKRVLAERRDETFNPYVASMEQGWVFTRTDVPEVPSVNRLAIAAVAALGLDFGAVDIMYLDGRSYVLEVNTAPGLAGTTLVKYGNAIRRYMGLAELSESVTRGIMDQLQTPVVQPVAARVASVNRVVRPEPAVRVNNDMVTLTIDRQTALKLRQLLANI